MKFINMSHQRQDELINAVHEWRRNFRHEIEHDIPHEVPEEVKIMNRYINEDLIDWRRKYHNTQAAIKMLKKDFAEHQNPITQYSLRIMQDYARYLMEARTSITEALRLTAYRYI